ncbi:ABC transporter permease subunit [Salinarchaeum laminariae]|uniref:ABC transporter permease subunit n=1 Tax=Salinarchaeum laminariae TaxID=869888 RepID=UPI0020C07B9B|nr:ABC transporter permease subunit [Salinarchaeum laminariae]
MKRFAKRILQTAFTIWAVITISFVLIRQLPGGPVSYLRAQFAQMGRDPEAANQLAEAYFGTKFDEPLWQQYIDYWANLLQGDMGRSVHRQEPVADLLLNAMPWTLLVMSIAIIFTYVIGILLGAAMAYREKSMFDSVGTIVSITLNSVPYYVAAIAFLFVFGYRYSLFPTRGTHSVPPGLDPTFVVNILWYATLPALSIVLTAVGGVAIRMRGNSVSILGEDYLRVARLRGLSSNRISSRYVVWNSVLPMYTQLMISIGFMFGGAVILERIFLYKGLGYFMFQGITSRDYPLMMGAFVLITVAVTLTILIADLTYGWIDPRATTSDETHASLSLRKLIPNFTRWVRGLRTSTDDGRSEVDHSDVENDAQSVFKVETSDDTVKYSLVDRLSTEGRAMVSTLLSDWRARVGLGIIGIYLLFGTVGLWFISEPTVGGPRRLQPFQNMNYVLGTNSQGESMLGLLVYSIPPMFKMILAGTLFTTVLATIVGTLSGYAGGAIDRSLMTLSDVMIALPGLPLLIVLAAVFKPESPYMIGLILSVPTWAGLARTIRSEVLSLRDIEYVESSRVMGLSSPSIIWRDILPNLMSYITVNIAYNARGIIFSSVALYFLGVLPYSNYNWGVLLNNGYESGALYTPSMYYRIYLPMIVITAITLGMILLAQGLDKIFNPRIRARHKGGSETDSTEASEDSTPATPAD